MSAAPLSADDRLASYELLALHGHPARHARQGERAQPATALSGEHNQRRVTS
jgi:hypothetical protein